MKNLALILVIFCSLSACSVFECEEEENCIVLPAEAVPPGARAAFTEAHPSATDVVWFDREQHGYCVHYRLDGKNIATLYDKDGLFVADDHNLDKDGEHRDHEDGDGCECEPDEDDDDDD